MKKEIFREYDIRGVFNENLFPEDATKIASAFSAFVQSKFPTEEKLKIVVGCDGRLSSPILYEKFIEGLAPNVEAILLGCIPTPAMYFASMNMQAHGGVIITGSHNPKNHNGFKLIASNMALYGSEIQQLYNIATDIQFGQCVQKIQKIDENYVQELLKLNNLISSNLKVVWDSGNGACGDIMKLLIEKLNGKHILLYGDIDGNFPNHHPDPTVAKNLEDLIKAVKENQADIGIAFDGDGDRVGFVMADGRILSGNEVLKLFAGTIALEHPGCKIIMDVKTSNETFEYVNQKGADAIIWKTGHSLIKAKMREEKAQFGGEMSGHLFFNDRYFGFDDGIYSALRMLEIISNKKYVLQEIIDNNSQFNSGELRVECDEASKFKIIEQSKIYLMKEGVHFSDIDGIRVSNKDFWWLMRASNTQNVIVICFEAKSKEKLQEVKEFIKNLLHLQGVKLPD